MTNAERKKAFDKARSAELKLRAALFAQTREDVIKLLNEALAEIKSLLATFPTEYENYKLPMLQKQIEKTLEVFSNNSAEVLSQGASKAWAGGQSLITAPIEAGGIRILSVMPTMDTRMLMAMSNFMTSRMKDVGKTAAAKINSQLGLVMIGAQSPGEAVGSITSILGEEARDRAITITRTELGRVHAVAAQQRKGQAVKYVPGLRKQWRRSGKIHSRLNHDLIDGQIQPVDKPFELKSKDGSVLLMMHPHDPASPASEVINCGCISIPIMKSWDVSTPGRKLYSQFELQHDPSGIKRAINDSILNQSKIVEAFNPDQPRDKSGRWIKVGIVDILTGHELGEHPTTKDLRKAAMVFAEKWIGDSFINGKSGHAIKITRQGLKHSLAGKNLIEIKLIAGLPKILTHSSYQGAYAPKLGTEHYIKAAHKYLAKVKVGNEVFYVGVITHEKWGGHEHYDHFIVSSK